ncbi:MAG: hypothetical protein HON90_16275 [Halobacteriovoraceae bacterium]|jgi:hypothetical protein|nr:hypothetical protein [Halobacteriovoraceae bacterium]
MDKHNSLTSEAQEQSSTNLVENFKSEYLTKSTEEINKALTKLNYLCLHLDPYNPDGLEPEVQILVEEFMLASYLSNPFDYTKIILQLLHSTEEELKQRLH